MKNKSFAFIALLLVLILMLSACNPEPTTPAPTGGEPAAGASTSPADAGSTGTGSSNAAAVGSCPTGTWTLTDFMPYILSVEQNLSSMTENEYTFSNNTISGMVTYVFNDDGTASVTGDNFSQSLTMSVNVGDQSMDVPITITINGTSTANYSIDGDKISFIDQQPGDMSVSVDVMGSATSMDDLLGQPGTVKLYQYTCPDANSLSLQVIAIEDMLLAPLTLSRVQ